MTRKAITPSQRMCDNLLSLARGLAGFRSPTDQAPATEFFLSRCGITVPRTVTRSVQRVYQVAGTDCPSYIASVPR